MDCIPKVKYIDIWVTADKREIPIVELTDTHICRILRKLSNRREKNIDFFSILREVKKRGLVWKKAE